MATIAPTARTTLRRRSARGSYDRATIDAILDEALFCHLGFTVDGQPFVIPTIHARVGDEIFVHGSAAGRMLRTVGEGVPVCLTVTLVDGLVLARAAFRHSMNYRSVVVLGRARAIVDPAAKLRALEKIVEHVVPGRWAEVRTPNENELKATSVLALPLEEASAKVRSGGPLDDEADQSWPCWAGELPLRLVPLAPVADARLAAGTALDRSLAGYRRPGRWTAPPDPR